MNTQGDLFDTYPQWLISEPHAVARGFSGRSGFVKHVVPSLPATGCFCSPRPTAHVSPARGEEVSIGRFQSEGGSATRTDHHGLTTE